ncbi:hypothetical protein F4809DRAFT_634639 [Biscogniauxia mediterranea]|nr:hypothetical protein F4809DRAFT_634639 [Biscogniauxia mediterranea]
MADIYTPVPDSAYLLNTPFYMPTESGSVWAVTFSSRSGTLITAGLSVVFTVIFACLWSLVCFIAISVSSKETRRRYVALVTLWNSNDAWFAFQELASYTFHYKWDENCRSDFFYGFLLTITAIVVYGASLALGIIGPSLIQIGSVAPARPSVAFYPATPPPNDYVLILQDFGLRAPGVLRALGSVEAADVTTRNRVAITTDKEYGTWNGTEPIYQLNYDYNITGTELGLQQGSDIRAHFVGSCITEYDWIYDQDTSQDLYKLWGTEDMPVPIDAYDIQNAPKASFISHPDAQVQYEESGNTSFAIVVWSAHRASITEGSDPWYKTESRPSNSGQANFNASFWIQRARPVLSCWQKDTWSYGSQTVGNISSLKNAAGIKVPAVLLNVLEAALTAPMLTRLGNASGDSALRSRTTSPNGVIDAGESSAEQDITRLLVASFVATRNVFVDSTMFPSGSSYDNLFEAADGQPADGAGDFVVGSPDIQTFSMAGLIVLFVVLVFLLILSSVIKLIIRLHEQPLDNKNKNNILVRFKVLAATQLFRRIYEPKEDSNDEYWPCDVHFPRKKDETNFELADCKKKAPLCKGHIKVSHHSTSSDQPAP